MTDRKLLEMAAKAAGIEVWTDVDGNLYTSMQDLLETPWNPLTNDGDALRLAVRLSIPISPEEVNGTIWICKGGIQVFESLGINPMSATRRAIVRAAAEIGKNMKEGK